MDTMEKIQKPSVPDYVSQSQTIQSLYLCENLHPLIGIRYVLGILMMAGSLISIPILAEQIPEEFTLTYVLTATVLFWLGVFILVAARNKSRLQKTTGFITTTEGYMYYLSIEPSVYQQERTPITKLGKIIYYNQQIQKQSNAESAQEEFLNSKEAIEEIEKCLNGKQTKPLFCITRMDAPHISRKNISNFQIKYWNQRIRNIEKITLFTNTKGFEQILDAIKDLDQKIDYRKLKQSIRH